MLANWKAIQLTNVLFRSPPKCFADFAMLHSILIVSEISCSKILRELHYLITLGPVLSNHVDGNGR